MKNGEKIQTAIWIVITLLVAVIAVLTIITTVMPLIRAK